MRTFRTLASALVVVSAVAVMGGAAHAASWVLTNAPTSGDTGLQPIGDTETWTTSGQSISAQAFSFDPNPSNSLVVGSTPVIAGQLGLYQGTGYGIGVTSHNENTASPDHTVSNEFNHDFVIFQIPTSFTTAGNTLSLTLSLNQFCSDGAGHGTTACSSISNGFGGKLSGTDNFDLWVGTGSLGAVDTAVGSSSETLTGLTTGFTHIDSKTLTGGSHSGDETLTITGLQPGDILVLAASLSDGIGTTNPNDYFKVANIGVTQVANPVKVPEPGTLALFGVGLAGLAALRRQRRKLG